MIKPEGVLPAPKETPEAVTLKRVQESYPQSEENGYLELVNLLLRYRRLIVSFALAGLLLLGAIAALSGRVYTAKASLLPVSNDGTASRLSGFAAQMGINVGGTDLGQSPAFYGALLKTREILQPTVQTLYAFRAGSDSVSGSLIELLDAKGGSSSEKLESALSDLDRRINVEVYPQTGLVQFKVHTPWAALSFQVAERLLALVNGFNLERRQAQARAEATFAEQLVEQARTELRQAENQLQEFLQRNRSYQSDPQLVFEQDRLQRAVTMRQDVYTSLFQSFQQARIDAVRDTPPMTVVERPHVPARADSRGVLIRALLGLIGGGLLAVFFAVLHNSFAGSERRDSPSRQQYAGLREDAIRDFKWLFRLHRRKGLPS